MTVKCHMLRLFTEVNLQKDKKCRTKHMQLCIEASKFPKFMGR